MNTHFSFVVTLCGLPNDNQCTRRYISLFDHQNCCNSLKCRTWSVCTVFFNVLTFSLLHYKVILHALELNIPSTVTYKNESCWETLAQRRLIARICALFKAYTGGRAWTEIGDRLLKRCYLSRDDHNRKIRTRKQRTNVGKYSFVNRTIRNWNQLSAGSLASFPCKLNTFRKRLKNKLQAVILKWGVSVNK